MLWLCIALTLGVLLAAFFMRDRVPEDWSSAVLVGLAMPVIALVVSFRHMYWKTISDAVEINEKQYVDIYEIYVRLAQEMGFGQSKGRMATIPRLYLAHGNGTLNAFASTCQVQKGYVVLYSDLLDVPYEHGDMDGIAFILAHELGHIKCGHVNAWRTAVRPIAQLLFLDKSLTRAQEWTADRCGYYYAPQGKEVLVALCAGNCRYASVDIDAYRESIRQQKDGFWLKFSNFMADHAVAFRRVEAAMQTDEKGWNVHGKML